jgi:transcriptional regulator with XRE-family HTH domain
MGDVLRAAISRSASSRYRISKATGVTESSLMRFVRGETSLRLDKAEAIADYLGLELVKRKAGGPARRPTSRKAKIR